MHVGADALDVTGHKRLAPGNATSLTSDAGERSELAPVSETAPAAVVSITPLSWFPPS
jgi:hypothetical protein